MLVETTQLFRPSSQHVYFRIIGYLVTMVVHVINIKVMLNGYQRELMHDPDIRMMYSLIPTFLTCWNFMLQIAYATLGLLCDILTLRNEGRKDYKILIYLKGIRDAVFSGIVFPVSLLVPIVFWPIFIYDRELILPSYVNKVLSLTSNHIIHTAIIPIVLWEIAFRPRTAPSSHKLNLGILTTYTAIYLFVLARVFLAKAVFPYPFMTMLYGTVYFYVFFVVTYTFLIFTYFLQWHISSFVWGCERKITKEL